MTRIAPIRTALTRLHPSMRYPIALGAMANASGGELAARVSAGGGLGFLGAGYWDADKLKSELEIVISILGKPERGTGVDKRLPIGVGFLAWRLTKINGSSPPSLGASDLDSGSPALALIDAALRSKPAAVWLAFGTPDDLTGWARVVREREAALNGGGKAKWGTDLKLWAGVGNVEQAKHATEEMSADVLSVTGVEAGGHSLATSPPLSSLLPLIVHSAPSWRPNSPSASAPLLVGAGGLSNGRSLLTTLALGAHGALFGTRFLLTPEASYTSAQKDLLRRAGTSEDPSGRSGTAFDPTRRSLAFDEARGTLDWPKDVDGRGLVSDTLVDYERGEGDVSKRQERYAQAAKEEDPKRIITWAGTGVGLMNEIVPAQELVGQLAEEAHKAMAELQDSFQPEG